MSNKLQISMTEESKGVLERLMKEVTEGFINGQINYSDLINEIILTAKIDARAIHGKYVNVRKSLRLMAAQEDIDLDSAIKTLTDLKAKGAKRSAKPQLSMDGVE